MDRPSYIQRNSNNNYSSNNNTFTPMVMDAHITDNNITPVINLLKVVFDIEPLEKYVDIRNVNFNDDSNDQNRDCK